MQCENIGICYESGYIIDGCEITAADMGHNCCIGRKLGASMRNLSVQFRRGAC